MRIISVRSHPFGAVEDGELRFGPGLTVVAGGNESGKSTWHAATTTAVGGRRRRQRKVDPDISRFQPWNRKDWAVSCVVELDNGRRIRLVHNLAAGVSQAIDDATGEDITQGLTDDGAVDASRAFGLNRLTMPLVSSVRQADILALADAKASDAAVKSLRDLLQQAVSSQVDTDASAEVAIARLESFAQTAIGTEKAGSLRPLRAALDARDAAVARQAAAMRAWDEHRRNEVALERSRQATEQLGAKIQALDRAEMAAAVRQLSQLVERVRLLESQAESAGVPLADRALVKRAQGVLAGVAHAAPIPRPPDRPSHLIRHELEALPRVDSGDTQPRPEIARLAAGLEGLHQQHLVHRDAEPPSTHPQPELDMSVAELREAAAVLSQPNRAVAPMPAAQRGFTPALVAFSVLALVLLAAGAAVGSSVLLTLGAAGVGAVAVAGGLRARPAAPPERVQDHEIARQSIVARIEALGLAADAGSLRALAFEHESAARAAAQRAEWMATGAAVTESIEGAASALHAALHNAGEPVEPLAGATADEVVAELIGSVTSYRDGCAERSRQQVVAAGRAGLQRELEAAAERESRITALSVRYSELTAELVAVAKSAAESPLHAWTEAFGVGDGISDVDAIAAIRRDLTEVSLDAEVEGRVDGGPVSAVAAALEQWVSLHERVAGRVGEARQAYAALTELLNGRTRAEVEAQLAEAQTLAQAHPAPAGVDWDPARRRQLAHDLADAEREANQRAGKIAEAERNLSGLAEVNEAVDRTRNSYERLQRLDGLVSETVTVLTAARQEVHRTVAPRIARLTNDRLARVSAGRYKQIRVNPEDLSVQVEMSDGQWRPAEQLSHGTAEQIYLLARAAIAEEVAGGEPCPLLLDDVTVHADADRTESLLNLLIDLSADRQIVLFSQEAAVRSWAETSGATIIDLPSV